MKRFLCVLTALLCVTGIMCACEENITPTVTPSDGIVTPTPTPTESLPTSITEFKIIYPEEDFSQSIYYKGIAFEFRSGLLANGITLKMGSDKKDPENGLSENKYEILFGPTNRAQSESVSNAVEIRQDDYIIRFIDDKIVVLAGSEGSYKDAIKRFTEICVDFEQNNGGYDNLAAINERFAMGNSPDGFFVDGVSLKNYKIVSNLSQTKINRIIDKIKETTGHVLTVGDVSETSPYEIVIGSVDREEVLQAREGLRDLDSTVKITNGKIIITAGIESQTESALNLFYEKFLDTKTDKKEFTEENSMINKYEYPIKSLKLLGYDISEYVIFAKDENDTAAQNIRKYINEATGIKLDIVTNGNPQKAIVLGNVQTKQYKELTVNLKSDEYIVKSVGTKIYLGTNDDYYEDGSAVHKFFENYLGYDIDACVAKNDCVEVDNCDDCAKIDDYFMKKADEAFIAEIDAKADALRSEILNTKTDVTYSGTAYYVSNVGNDENDGLTPQTAWASIERVSNADELKAGDAVFFNRGDLFRGHLKTKSGVTYSAYGEGEKPKIYGSSFDGAKYGTWEEVAPNVYRYSEKFDGDVGLITMNNHEQWTIKVLQNFSVYPPVNSINEEKFADYNDLHEDLTFWHDLGNPKETVQDHEIGYIYLCSTQGNPSERFENIEFNEHGNIISCEANVTIDNLCVMYGGCHGVAATRGTTVQNCEVCWIGGSILYYSVQGYPTRFGNGVEAYGSSSDFTVKHCYIYQCYDTGVTHQGTGGSVMENITYANNLLEYNVWDVEYYIVKPTSDEDSESYMKNILVENNIMRYTGYGWGMQRPNRTASSVLSWVHWNRQIEDDSYFIIRNNIMQYCAFATIYTSSEEEEWLPVYENNVIIQQKPTERKENPTKSLWVYADPYYWTHLRCIGESKINADIITLPGASFRYENQGKPYCYSNIAVKAFAQSGNVFYLAD